MPLGNWRFRPLSELSENLDSRRVPVKEADRRPGPFPYYGASGIVDHIDAYLFDGLHLLVAEDGENLRTRKLPIAFLADGKFWVNNHAHIIRANDDSDTRFLMYALAVADVASYLTGSTMPKLTQGNLHRIPIYAPDRDEQIEIAAILGALDDKIELHRRMNETLEAMAQAIFKDWFVDFGPTRRKLAGITDPVAIMGGLVQDPARAATLAALFPAALGNDGLPVGWEKGTLTDLATLNPEVWSARNQPAHIEYVDLANTKWGTIEATTNYSRNQAPSRAKRVIRKGDTIVGTVRPGNGSYAFVGRDGLTASTGFAVLRPYNVQFAPLLYCAATRRENIERLAALADGGAYPAIRPELAIETELSGSRTHVASFFGTLGSPLMEKIAANKAESSTLAATRDLLLPKLMSGEIRLRDAEAIAEDAT